MDSYIFFIKTQSVVKSLELTEAEILSDDCCGIFFTKGKLSLSVVNDKMNRDLVFLFSL